MRRRSEGCRPTASDDDAIVGEEIEEVLRIEVLRFGEPFDSRCAHAPGTRLAVTTRHETSLTARRGSVSTGRLMWLGRPFDSRCAHAPGTRLAVTTRHEASLTARRGSSVDWAVDVAWTALRLALRARSGHSIRGHGPPRGSLTARRRRAVRRIEWCERRDSNSHALASASPSSWCVCQFRHFREEGAGSKDPAYVLCYDVGLAGSKIRPTSGSAAPVPVASRGRGCRRPRAANCRRAGP